MEGKTLRQQIDLLSVEIARQRQLYRTREYKRHYQIILIDLTQPDTYGIPKIKLIPGGTQTLAYPYKVRIQVKGYYDGREFEADIGGFTITQTSGGW